MVALPIQQLQGRTNTDALEDRFSALKEAVIYKMIGTFG
jgi:hypothetical protein